jgi:hypothetical protein
VLADGVDHLAGEVRRGDRVLHAAHDERRARDAREDGAEVGRDELPSGEREVSIHLEAHDFTAELVAEHLAARGIREATQEVR